MTNVEFRAKNLLRLLKIRTSALFWTLLARYHSDIRLLEYYVHLVNSWDLEFSKNI